MPERDLHRGDGPERTKTDFTTFGVGAAVVCVAFLLYLLTAARDIVVGDTPELITVAVTLGVAHPPGYPLFTMLAHLFSLLPIGPIPFRVNLLAATCNALTGGVVYFTALRLRKSCRAAAVGALVLATSSLFWTWSLVTDVFPLNNLLASLQIYFLTRWHEQPEHGKFLVAAFLVAGSALANQQTIILLAPAFCFVLWQRREVCLGRPQLLVIGAAAFLLGFLPYTYVWLAAARHPVLNWGGISSFKDVLALIARRSYGSHSLVSTPGYKGGSLPDRVLVLISSFGPLMAPLIVLGLIDVYRKLTWYFWFSLLGFGFAGPFFVSITNLNLATAPAALYVLSRFFILSHVVLAPLIALGILTIAEFIGSFRIPLPISALGLATGVVAIGALATVLMTYRTIDQSHNHLARTFAEDVYATVKPETILLATGDAVVLPLTYLQAVEGMRGDVTLILAPLLPADWYLRQLQEHHPNLNIPFTHYDGGSVGFNNLKALIEANKGRTIAVVGNLPGNDASLTEGYWPYQYGLINIIEPNSKDIPIEEMVKDNEQLLISYKIPASHDVRIKTFEADLLSLYALPALRIGDTYERFGKREEARDWYHRAFAIDPYLPQQAREALARVER